MYNRKLIWKYINGEEIPNIDRLESDYRFMLEVIRITNDKKMYNLCSDEIKLNYEFIRFIIEYFQKDKKFIMDIATNYIKKIGSEDITSKEIIFLICDLINDNTDNYDNEEILAFNLKRSAIYNTERVTIEMALSEEELFWQQELGLGFIYIISDELGKSEIITRYFAKCYLNEIFYCHDDLTLEDLIHEHFSTYENLKKIGIKKYILNYVAIKDKYLAEYLLNNLYLIKKLEKSIVYIGLNWDNYIKRKKEQKQDLFEQGAEKLIEKYGTKFNLSEICRHIDNLNLNLPVKLSECLYYDSTIDDYVDYSKDIIDIIDEKNISFNDRRCIQEIINLVKYMYITSEKETKFETKAFTITPIVKKEQIKARILNFNKRADK